MREADAALLFFRQLFSALVLFFQLAKTLIYVQLRNVVLDAVLDLGTQFSAQLSNLLLNRIDSSIKIIHSNGQCPKLGCPNLVAVLQTSSTALIRTPFDLAQLYNPPPLRNPRPSARNAESFSI